MRHRYTIISPGSPSGLLLGVVAIAFGGEAILAGYAVHFVTAMTLVASLGKVHTERRLPAHEADFVGTPAGSLRSRLRGDPAWTSASPTSPSPGC